MSAKLLLSYSHQPLTVALVYGDKRNFDLRRRIFTWSPLLFVVAVLVTRHVSLTTLAVVAAVWNAEHTLMQRYGITRIYGARPVTEGTSRSSCCSRGSRSHSCGSRRQPNPRPHRTDRLGGKPPRARHLTDLQPARASSCPSSS